jgi:hypothetical protein
MMGSIDMTLFRPAILTAAVLALSALIPIGSAQAGDGGGVNYYVGSCSGGVASIAIYSPGISFLAKDRCADGHSGVAQWKIGGSSTIHTLWAHGGAGDVVSQPNSLPSSTSVLLRTCVGEYASRDVGNCSDWKSV